MRAVTGKKVVLDCAGDSLLHGINEKPYLIKPNLPEMEAIMRKELRTLRNVRDASFDLIERGAQNVVVSMGKYCVRTYQSTAVTLDTLSRIPHRDIHSDAALFAPALPVEARSTVGAGDSMVGGILAGLSCGAEIQEAFRYGVAAGAASVMTDGTQLVYKKDFDLLLPKVTVQEV